MYYGEIKNRQKIEVLCGDSSKAHLVLNFFREPTPLEKFRYAATLRWKKGVVVEKRRFKVFDHPCHHEVVVAFDERLIKATTHSHRDCYGFLPTNYLSDYIEDYDYVRVHFNKDKESKRVRHLQSIGQERDLSLVRTALETDSWISFICSKEADRWTDEDLEKFGKDFYCKHFGGTLEAIKADALIAVVNDVRRLSDMPPI